MTSYEFEEYLRYSQFELQEVSTEYVVNCYKEAIEKQNGEYYLYIDSPFCIKACKYCMFLPVTANYTSSVYNNYFAYLYSMMDKFGSILKTIKPKEVYFGGGTPNYNRLEEFAGIRDRIKDFNMIGQKAIECNPVLLTEEKLDFIIGSKFTYVSFGIQSLSKEVLRTQNRLPCNVPQLKRQIAKLQMNGIYVNCDLLAFMETGKVEDLSVLRHDLEHIWELNLNSITLYPMVQHFTDGYSKEGDILLNCDKEDAINRLRRYRGEIARHVRSTPNVGLKSFDLKDFLSEKSILELAMFDTILIRDGKLAPHEYNCSGFPNFPENQISIGMGGLMNKRVYGHINRESYYEVFEVDGEPRFLYGKCNTN